MCVQLEYIYCFIIVKCFFLKCSHFKCSLSSLNSFLEPLNVMMYLV